MCGIFGVFGFTDKILLKNAVRSMTHRGPDSDGFFIGNNVMLGVRRLKIIDLEKGDQPVYNEDKSVVVVYNGEIYNYKELRKELEAKGHKFYSNSDTEVVVHSYEEYGVNCINHFNGMFAIALWDTNKKKLFLFRDRYGIKPLYYFQSKNAFIFSSEIKAILKYKEAPKKLNKKAIPYYLKYRYFKGPDTFIEDISKLKPGHFIELEKNQVRIKRYYSLELANKNIDINKSRVKLDSLLEDSVNKRLVSDVPLGIFLSGGVDSSILLHYAKNYNPRTFTIGFETESKYNEFKAAKAVSNYYETDHHEISINSETFVKNIPNVVYQLEEPIADATAVSIYLLSRFASKKVKTVLSGEGADEIFGGYVYYNNMHYYKTINKLPMIAQKAGSYGVKILPETMLSKFFKYPWPIGDEGKQRLINLLDNTKSDTDAYDKFISLYDNNELKKVLAYSTNINKTNLKNDISIYKKMFKDSMDYWLPDYILARVDKMSMANSLECRVPFLDSRIVDYVSKIKHYPRRNKYLLRAVIKDKLPNFISKKSKFPFYSPIIDWHNTGLKDYYKTIFSNSRLIKNKIISEDHITKLFKTFDNSKFINSRKLWSLLTLELSTKNYIEDEN